MPRCLGLDGKYNQFVGTCVELDGEDVMRMVDSAISVTASTFKKNIGRSAWDWLEVQLGYSDLPGLSLASDYGVSFHRSQYQGQRCYYCRWSAIEHIFIEG